MAGRLTIAGRIATAALAVVLACGPWRSAALAQNGDATSDRPACQPQPPTGVPASRLALMARGFNLTGWLDTTTPRRPDETALAALRRRGLTHIRLPVAAERLMDAFSTRDRVTEQLRELDRAIDHLIALGFGVSLDLHPGDRLGRLHVADRERAFDLITSAWTVLARRYADRSVERLFFEVLNEPTVRADPRKTRLAIGLDAMRPKTYPLSRATQTVAHEHVIRTIRVGADQI